MPRSSGPRDSAYWERRRKRRARRIAARSALSPARADAPPIRLLSRDDLDRLPPPPPTEGSGMPRCFTCGASSENVVWYGDVCMDCATEPTTYNPTEGKNR